MPTLQPILSENELTQSFQIHFSLLNDGGFEYANSTDRKYFDNWNITVDQLEGEINVPYQFVNENSVRRIDIPQSILGGFSQFRVNYIFTQHPNSPQTEQGIFVSGHVETDRIFTPAFIPGENVQQTDTFPPIDENYIREVFADKIYDVFFKTLELPSEIDLDYSSLQSTIRDGKIVTGRQENEKLVFYKKDRNTPENRKDFSDGILSDMITSISASAAQYYNPSEFDLVSWMDDKVENNEILVQVDESTPSSTVDDPSIYDLPNQEQPYLLNKILYVLKFHNGGTPYRVDFSEIQYVVSEPNPDTWLWYEFANVMNLSQITRPKLGNRINPLKAKEVLNTNIFELLPAQSTRQTEIDNLFERFDSLIGSSPSFEDVDGDGVAEKLLDPQVDARISTNPNNPNAFVTRLNTEANVTNQNKTLESMRNRLNTYLLDVDNIVDEIQDDRPEYENKSSGFLKIRKPNQAIIIRNQDGNELEFQKNNSFLLDGFTISMWVRFVGKTGRGTLFNFGNPYKSDVENRYGFRLETLTREDDGVFKRMVRLVVWDHREGQNKLYDSHVGTQFVNRYHTVDNGQLLYETEQGEAFSNSLNAFNAHTQIPTDDLDEWFFICATYNPTVNEEGSFGEGYESVLTNTEFWLNHVWYLPSVPARTEDINFGLGTITDSVTFTSFITEHDSNSVNQYLTDLPTTIRIVNDDGEEIERTITNIEFIEGGAMTGPANRIFTVDDNLGSNNSQIGFRKEVNVPAQEGLSNLVDFVDTGARCKVEVISRSDLLRARGFKVNGD